MPSIEERIRTLVDDNLQIEGRQAGTELDMNASLRDSGISSMEFVEFTKVVAQEFNVSASIGDCADINTVGELVSFLQSKGV